ncbi:MAG: ABC transporter permease [Pseudomonadota bacterium]
MLAGLYGLAFVRVAPNRLLSGEPISLFSMLHGPAWGLALLLAGLVGAAFLKPGTLLDRFSALAAGLLIPGLLCLAASYARQVALAESPIARTSLGGAFWLAVLLLGLVLADALTRSGAGRAFRFFALMLVMLPALALLASGFCDELSIMKEYANRSDIFWPALALARHLQIVVLALVFTLCIGLPLGWAAHRFESVGRLLFPVLNIIQTIPSIALFGLLMAPLALLAASWPVLGKAGISGVGLAPGLIALTLYSLLPVVRGTLAGLAQVPSAVRQAADGLGMSAVQRFWQLEVPLALPVVLGGVRTGAIQAIGLAAVTALIGAGGLGSIMFEGLFSSAQDLVLLGVLPIVLMGALADALFKVLISVTAHKGGQV